MYITEADYLAIYPGDVPPSFSRLSWEADRLIDRYTTGVDGYCKLRNAYPIEEADVEAVKRCAAEIIHMGYLWELEDSDRRKASAIIQNDDGTVQSALVASRSAGNESITYATGAGKAATTTATGVERQREAGRIIRAFLSGARDKNGVNLLWLGEYPSCIPTP